MLPLLPSVQVHCPCEAEFLSYYLLLSRSTFGSFRGSTSNVVRLLNQMEPDVLVRWGGGGMGVPLLLAHQVAVCKP
jgi:hypothetical protein